MDKKDIIRAEESAKKYLEVYGDPSRVGVDVKSKLGACEPFCFYASKKSSIKNKDVPYHVSYSQLNRLEGGKGEIYGRTEYGPFCLLRIYGFKIIYLRVLPESEQKKIKHILEGGDDYV